MSKNKDHSNYRALKDPKLIFAFGALSCLPFTASAQSAAATSTAADDEEEEIFELSPFEVTSDSDVGYMATSTLAGSRLNTKLRDVGAAVQAITPEFMKDVGATDLQKLLVYTTNTEVAGIGGNFYGGDTWDKNHARGMLISPQNNTRIRGLNNADITRDYFPSDIPIDWYSLSRVDISRGPNSILFGLGSPAGLINNTLKTPVMGESNGSVELRIDKYGSIRGMLDIDKTLIPGRLGVRVSVLNDETKYRQNDTYNDDRRVFAALRWTPKLSDGIFTQFDANGEWGKITGNRPVSGTPADFLTNWYEATNRNTVLNDEYWTDPGNPGFGAYEAKYAAQSIGGQVWDDHPVSFYNSASSSAVGGSGAPDAMMLRGWMNVNGGGWGSFVGLTNPNWEINNPSHRKNSKAYYEGNATLMGIINDYESQTGQTFSGFGQGLWPTQMIIDGPIAEMVKTQNIVGPNKEEFNNFETFNLGATQSYFNNRLGWNIAYNKQDYRSGYTNLVEGLWGGNIISIDTNESLRNGQGNNPNLGRLYTIGEGRGGIFEKERENWRASVFAELRANDFFDDDSLLTTILGKHTLTGVTSSEKYEGFDRYFALHRWDLPFSQEIGWSRPGYATWRGIHYLSGSQLDTTAMDQITGVTGITANQSPDLTQTVLGVSRNASNNWEWGTKDYNLLSWKTDLDKLYDGAGQNEKTTDSNVFVWQGSMLNGAVVPIFGWRRDEFESWTKPSPTDANSVERGKDPANGVVLPYSPNWTFDADRQAPIVADAERRSWSVALHGRELLDLFGVEMPGGVDVSLLYNNSSSFKPEDLATDVYGRQEENPSGDTEDVSLLLSGFENKVTLRVTKYRTVQMNTGFIGDAPAFNRNKAILGRSMDGMMWEIGPQWGAFSDDPAKAAEEAANRWQPTPEWLVNNWMFGEGGYDSAIANTPLPADWRDHPEIMNQPLRIRAAALPSSPNYVKQGDLNPYSSDDPESQLPYVAPPLTVEEIAYRTQWFNARSDAEWSRPVDQTFWTAMDFERMDAAWGGFWELTAWQVPGSSKSLNDLESTGTEYELTANPIPNWRISFNASKAEAVRSNVLKSWDEYIEKNMPFWFDGGYSLYDAPAMDYWSFKGFYDIPESPGSTLGSGGRLGTGYGADILAKYYQAKATENQLVNELRKWHFNFVTNYTFVDGKFKGLGVGGAYRWMDKSNLGYYPKYDMDANAWVNDVNNPIKGASEDYLDLWVSYETNIGDDKTWSIQLNVYDLFADDSLVPTASNPDGTIAQVRIPGQTTWALTNTIRF